MPCLARGSSAPMGWVPTCGRGVRPGAIQSIQEDQGVRGGAPGGTSASPQACNGRPSGGWSTWRAASFRARQPASRRAGVTRQTMGCARRRPWSGARRRSGNAWRHGRVEAGHGRVPLCRCGTACLGSAPAIPVARHTTVCAWQGARRPPRWPLAARLMAGLSGPCCRCRSHHRAGHHPSTVGVPHTHANVSLSSGAGTTVSCRATADLHCDYYSEISVSHVTFTKNHASYNWQPTSINL